MEDLRVHSLVRWLQRCSGPRLLPWLNLPYVSRVLRSVRLEQLADAASSLQRKHGTAFKCRPSLSSFFASKYIFLSSSYELSLAISFRLSVQCSWRRQHAFQVVFFLFSISAVKYVLECVAPYDLYPLLHFSSSIEQHHNDSLHDFSDRPLRNIDINWKKNVFAYSLVHSPYF